MATQGGVAANQTRLTFQQPVLLTSSLPNYFITEAAARTIISAQQEDAQSIVVTWSAALAVGSIVNVPQNDPGIRTQRGGFVQAGILQDTP